MVGKACDDLGSAITIGIPERDHTATGRVRLTAACASQVDVDVALGGDIQVPGALETVGDHEGAETLGKNQTAVVRVTRRKAAHPLRLGGRRDVPNHGQDERRTHQRTKPTDSHGNLLRER